jgi:hypothetical protein
MKKIIFILIYFFMYNCYGINSHQDYYQAVIKGNISIVEKMIKEHGFDIKGQEGDTSPLHWAAEAGQVEMIKWLIAIALNLPHYIRRPM